AAAIPPVPGIEATAEGGTMTPAGVYTLAVHPWCAAAAALTIGTAVHMLPACGANAVGTSTSAMSSIAVLRARFAVHPRFMRPLESQPPAIEPTSATR